MGHCKDCTYWESHTGWFNKSWSTCSAAELNLDSRTSNIREEGLEIYIDVLDDSGLDCGMRTGKLFGCILFKPNLKGESK